MHQDSKVFVTTVLQTHFLVKPLGSQCPLQKIKTGSKISVLLKAEIIDTNYSLVERHQRNFLPCF